MTLLVDSPARIVSTSARAFDAAIFDMDGVITDTASVHARAWKQMFDEYLRLRAGSDEGAEGRAGRPAPPRLTGPVSPAGAFQEFTHADYRTYVDGRPRYQGVEAFLASRGIRLPRGTPNDPAGPDTICALGNRKNELFNAIIESDGVQVYGSTLALIHDLRARGVKVGLATSSRNSALILGRTNAGALFGTIVDGLVSERLGLKGKPHPDIFVTAAANLGVPCARAIVVEDAVSGVRAGAAGGFGLVVGVAREGNAQELRENGADVVVHDLAEVSVEEINRRIRLKGAAA